MLNQGMYRTIRVKSTTPFGGCFHQKGNLKQPNTLLSDQNSKFFSETIISPASKIAIQGSQSFTFNRDNKKSLFVSNQLMN